MSDTTPQDAPKPAKIDIKKELEIKGKTGAAINKWIIKYFHIIVRMVKLER